MTSSFDARKAIESLRAGVPNYSAVEALGLDSTAIVQAFERNVRQSKVGSTPRFPRGFFVEGNFGSGKSHALKFLQTLAIKEKMAFSLVPISKEAPLHDLAAIYRSSIASINFGAGVLNGSLCAVFESFEKSGNIFDGLYRAACDPKNKLDPVFAATLAIFRRYAAAPEILEQLFDFWDGGPPQINPWKKLLKDTDERDLKLKAIPAAELPLQRFRFAAIVLNKAGYNGWYLALDELELISKFGVGSRARGYASLAALFADDVSDESLNLWFPVGAITGDLITELLDKRRDADVIKAMYRWEPNSSQQSLAGIALLSDNERIYRLKEPNVVALTQAHEEVRILYQKAYNVRCDRALKTEGGRLSKSMRQYVREWIAFWDLKMLDTGYNPEVDSRSDFYSLEEDSDFEDRSE